MGYPVVTVEVAFSTDPFSAPGAWTDITAYLRGAETARGRQTELDRVEAGVGSIQLRNADRRFEPENAGGAYYPNVKPMRHCRIRATFNAITYDIFRGFIEAWTPTYIGPPNSGGAAVTAQIVDAYKLLSLIDIRALQTLALELGAIAVYPMDDTDAVCRDVSETAPANGTYVSGARGAGGSPFSGGAAVADFDGTDDRVDFAAPTKIRDGIKDDHTITFWLYVDTAVGVTDYIIEGGLAMEAYVTESSAGFFVLRYGLNAGSFISFESNPVAYDTWNFFTLRRKRSTGTMEILVNAVSHIVTSDAALKPALDVSTWDLAFMATAGGGGGTEANGALAGMAFFSRYLSDEEITSLYRAPIDRLAAAASGAQINAVLNAAGWPAGERTIDAGNSTLTAIVPSGSALGLLQDIEASEGGLLFMTPDGKVGFHERHAIAKAPHNTSAATFGDGGGAEVPYTHDGIEFSYDDENIWNHVTVTREGGAPQIVQDAASIATYGRRSLERDGLRLTTDSEALDLANYLLSRYKDPLLRLKSLTLNPTGDDDVWPQALGRDIHYDRVTVKRRPPPSGTITKEVHVAAIAHEFHPAARKWKTTLTLTPADPLTYWILGDSTYGVLGSTTRLGY